MVWADPENSVRGGGGGGGGGAGLGVLTKCFWSSMYFTEGSSNLPRGAIGPLGPIAS